MTERGLRREAAKLRERLGPTVCVHPAPCQTTTRSEVRVMPDGGEVRTGAEPLALCGGCPTREERRPPIRHVEVRLRHGSHGGEIAARTAHNGHDEEPEGYGSPQATDVPTAPVAEAPDDGMPAAWGPDHPARLALEGREPPPAWGSRNPPGGPSIKPGDFSL